MFFRIKLAKSSAEKARNSLASGLYEELFRQIMQYINYNLSTSSVLVLFQIIYLRILLRDDATNNAHSAIKRSQY